jgi:hypothetical protein
MRDQYEEVPAKYLLRGGIKSQKLIKEKCKNQSSSRRSFAI